MSEYKAPINDMLFVLRELAGLDEDATHWVSVAIRESVINAVKHGNRGDRAKHVTVEFRLEPQLKPEQFSVEVLDEGEGFDYEDVGDPLAPENLIFPSHQALPCLPGPEQAEPFPHDNLLVRLVFRATFLEDI